MFGGVSKLGARFRNAVIFSPFRLEVTPALVGPPIVRQDAL